MHGLFVFVAGLFTVVGLILLFGAIYGVTYFGFGPQFSIGVAVALLVAAAISAWLLNVAIRAQYRRVKTGWEALDGAVGVANTDINPKGEVRVNGEFWQATTAEKIPIKSGQKVQVVGLKGMFLVVKAVEEKA
jgi:membrane-bound serine protease (ClpP class)